MNTIRKLYQTVRLNKYFFYFNRE